VYIKPVGIYLQNKANEAAEFIGADADSISASNIGYTTTRSK